MSKLNNLIKFANKLINKYANDLYKEIDLQTLKSLSPAAYESITGHHTTTWGDDLEVGSDPDLMEDLETKNYKILYDKDTNTLVLKFGPGDEKYWTGSKWETAHQHHSSQVLPKNSLHIELPTKKQMLEVLVSTLEPGKLTSKPISTNELYKLFPEAMDDFNHKFYSPEQVSWKATWKAEDSICLVGQDNKRLITYWYNGYGEEGEWSFHKETIEDYVDALKFIKMLGGDIYKEFETYPKHIQEAIKELADRKSSNKEIKFD